MPDQCSKQISSSHSSSAKSSASNNATTKTKTQTNGDVMEYPPHKSVNDKCTEDDDDEEEDLLSINIDTYGCMTTDGPNDKVHLEQDEFIKNVEPKTELEIAQRMAIMRLELQISRFQNEIKKLKAFISKRKQTYKRKRKDNQAPIRPLSAYNIFIKSQFSKLASENEAALLSADEGAQLKRVPPASIVASTGGEWKHLSAEEKAKYEAMAESDRKRYEKEMENYTPPERDGENKKRSKTGYNMFFSAYVLQLKQSAAGVPPERGSVARLVGNAWKELNANEKLYYEREAERQNELMGNSNNSNNNNNKRNEDAIHYPLSDSPIQLDAAAPPPHEERTTLTNLPTVYPSHGWLATADHSTNAFHLHHNSHNQYHLGHQHFGYHQPLPHPGYYHGPPQPTNPAPWNL